MKPTKKLAAGLLVLTLAAAACGSDESTSTTAAPTTAAGTASTAPAGDTTPVETEAPETMPIDTEASDTTTADTMDHSSTPDTSGAEAGGGGVEAPASTLRSGLTSLLQEHVYLAGIAISTAVGAGGDMEAPAVTSAVETLDANSVALSEAITSVYGEAGGEQFLELWRNHIGFFVQYTLGGATGDAAMQDEAKAALDNYRQDFGAFLESATEGNIGQEAVAAELQVHVDTLLVAVDAVLAGTPDVFPKLQEAASHMPGTALALAGAITAQYPDKFPS